MRDLVRVIVVAIGIGFLYPATARGAIIINTTLDDPGPPARLEFTVQDALHGIVSLVVTLSENADTVVPPFIPGTTDPIVLSSTKIDQTQIMRIGFVVTSGTGEVLTFITPEPSSLLLLATGAGLLIRRRRQST